MHVMSGNETVLDWKEGPRSDMQADILHINSALADILEHSFGKMETGSRCGHRPAVLGVKSLIAIQVYCFRVPIEIGRNRYIPANFEHTREGHAVLPSELDLRGLSVTADKICRKSNL